jgi:hypothetical protein
MIIEINLEEGTIDQFAGLILAFSKDTKGMKIKVSLFGRDTNLQEAGLPTAAG